MPCCVFFPKKFNKHQKKKKFLRISKGSTGATGPAGATGPTGPLSRNSRVLPFVTFFTFLVQTDYQTPLDTEYLFVQVWGGGGGGGSFIGGRGSGGGGGGGGYLEAYINETLGFAGQGGSAANSAGNLSPVSVASDPQGLTPGAIGVGGNGGLNTTQGAQLGGSGGEGAIYVTAYRRVSD